MNAQKTKTFRLRLERTIRAKRARVFEAWTNPGDLALWSVPESMEAADGATDLRVGGRWSVVMRDPERGVEYHATGEYREIVPPERLVFTHRWLTDPEPVETLVTVEFHEEDGATRVVMIHEGFLSEAVRDGHVEGWTSCLGKLERLVA
jgi:uncharacterized protein YndB with AHSA1/START domain